MKDNALAGGIAGISARLLSNPLDVVKIRFQLQEEAINKTSSVSKYTGFSQSLRTIIREEGVTAFWKGTVPGTWLYFVYGSVQFSSFELVNRILKERVGLSNPSGRSFISGCFGGASATIISYPLDTLRTRLIGQGSHGNKYYRNLMSGIRMMYEEVGIRAFYRGLTPTLLVIVPQSGISFGMYHSLKHVWHELIRIPSHHQHESQVNKPIPSKGKLDSLVFGGVAGLISKTTVLPFDIVKKRLQIQGFEEARRPFGQTSMLYGMVDAFNKIYVKEGALGFYKGALPGIMKTSFASAVFFYVYEYTLFIVKSI